MVDNLIRLFESTAIDFSSNGIGSLPDATTCVVTEERNGEYELEMDYPVNGVRFNEITHRRIIVAKPNQYSNPQPFRIYAISKPINGIITVNAAHISYDLSGYTVSPFYAINITNALVDLKNNIDETCPFEFESNKQTVATIKIVKPMSVRSVLGGTEGSILDIYHGEYEFDGFTVKLWENRGQDRGVIINYGKNLTDIKQDENCNSVYTAVRPYWYKEAEDSSGGLVDLPEKIIAVGSGQQNYTKVYTLDLSEDFEKKPTASQLRTAARQYINSHDLDKPNVSIDVSFIQLSDSKEYSNVALMEDVRLCDIVTVKFPTMGISAKSKCIKTVFDVLTQKYTSIELGDAKSNLATTVSDNSKAIEKTVTKSAMDEAVNVATKMITGNLGGYVRLNDSNLDGEPDEILIMDTDDIETATNVWRWNKNGLGFSSTGYNGTYGTAVTSNGKIVANYITAGILNADLIKAGTLADVNGNSTINLASGEAIINRIQTKNSMALITSSGVEKGRQYISFNNQGTSGTTGLYFKSIETDKKMIELIASDTKNAAELNLYTRDNKPLIRLYSYNDTGSGGRVVVYNAPVNGSNKQVAILTSSYSPEGGYGYLALSPATGEYPNIYGSGGDGEFVCVTLRQTSSRKVKDNIKPMDKDEAYKILNLEAVSFDFKDKNLGENKRGFIAEDVEKILPNLVSPETDGKVASLNYTGMIPYLQMVIKDQEKRIQALEEKINKLLEE